MTNSIFKEKEKETTGSRVRKCRENHKPRRLTQEELGKKIGRSRYSVIDIEQDKASNPLNTEELKILCDLFHCEADYLLCRIDTSTHQIEDIHQAIGLSENAIKTLIALSEENNPQKKALADQIINCINLLLKDVSASAVFLDMLFFMDTDYIKLKNQTIEYDPNPVVTSIDGKKEALHVAIVNDDDIETLQLSNSLANLDFTLTKDDQSDLVREFLKTRIFEKLKSIANDNQSKSATVADNINNKKGTKKNENK